MLPWRGIVEDYSAPAPQGKEGLSATDRSSSLSFGLIFILNCRPQTPMAPGLIIDREEGRAGFRGDDHPAPTSSLEEGPNAYGHGNGHVEDDGLLQPDKLDPIAIVGLALRFPQDATSPEAFWQMLLEGRSALTDVPQDRYRVDAFYEASANKSGTVCNIRLISSKHLIAHETLDERQRRPFP